MKITTGYKIQIS